MAYWTPQALGQLAQSESGGNPSLVHYPNNVAWGGSSTRGSSATGLYGYLTSTWQTYAPQAGVDIKQYPYAYTAPASVQNQVALITPVSNWSCPGCNSVAASMVQNSANISATPVSSTNFTAPPGTPDSLVVSDTPGSQSEHPLNPGDYSSDPNSSFNFNDPNPGTSTSSGTNPQGVAAQSGQGMPVQVNLGPSTATDLQSFVTAPIKAAENWASAQFAALSNWFTRGFLILLAIVIIMVALWKATGSPNVTEIARAA